MGCDALMRAGVAIVVSLIGITVVVIVALLVGLVTR